MFKQNKNKKWTPLNNLLTINRYLETVKKDIKQRRAVPPRKIRSNLREDEKLALKYLSKRDDIIITNADKSGAVVIIHVNDYSREAKCQLNDPRNYKVPAKDPATTNNDLINQTIGTFTKEQLINDSNANGLKNPSLEPRSFTYLQKVTKKVTQVVLW